MNETNFEVDVTDVNEVLTYIIIYITNSIKLEYVLFCRFFQHIVRVLRALLVRYLLSSEQCIIWTFKQFKKSFNL